jgi:hypothetical protein
MEKYGVFSLDYFVIIPNTGTFAVPAVPISKKRKKA